MTEAAPVARRDAAWSVLDVTEWYGETSGGIRTYLDEKAAFVAGQPSWRQVVVVPGQRDEVEEAAHGRRYRLRGPRIPRHRPYRFMLATRSLSRILREERPSIVELGSPFLVPWIVAPVAKTLRVPLVCFHHTNVSGLVDRSVHGAPVLRRAAGRATRAYLHRLNDLAAVSIVASRAAREELEDAGVARIVDVPLGVDTVGFAPPLRAERGEVRRQWGLPADVPLAGFLGRFAAEKSLDVVLNAWPAVERATGARLVLIGAGPEEARLRAHSYGARVAFLPFQTERAHVARLLAALDVMVAPGALETFGLSALEALSCGTPVLSADRGGVAEQVQVSGAGRCFEAGNAEALAAAALELLAADRTVLGAKGRAFAESRHAWPVVFARLFAVYREVMRA